MDALLAVEGISKRYQTRHGVIRAVDNVSFEVGAGETVALVGESGCGKSTVALALLRLINHDRGRVLFEGVDFDAIGRKQQERLRQHLSIVFQNPYSSLDPRMRVRDIVGEPLRTAYGMRGRELYERVRRHLEAVGLGREHMKRFPHEFSGGQRQRIAVARALALEPKLVILDEPTASLDVSVQAQVLNLLHDLQRRLGLSYLIITHNLAIVESIADRILVMYFGRLVETGRVDQVFAYPRHPYTRALLDSVPSLDPSERGRLKPLEGELPSPLNPPPGCAFAARCPRARAECKHVVPALDRGVDDHHVACHFPLDSATA